MISAASSFCLASSTLALVGSSTASSRRSTAIGRITSGYLPRLISPQALADPQRTARQVLVLVLEQLLVLLHPLMPHLSEELWHGLTGAPEGTFLALQPWPAPEQGALDQGLRKSASPN